jgi:hypothetical protein
MIVKLEIRGTGRRPGNMVIDTAEVSIPAVVMANGIKFVGSAAPELGLKWNTKEPSHCYPEYLLQLEVRCHPAPCAGATDDTSGSSGTPRNPRGSGGSGVTGNAEGQVAEGDCDTENHAPGKAQGMLVLRRTLHVLPPPGATLPYHVNEMQVRKSDIPFRSTFFFFSCVTSNILQVESKKVDGSGTKGKDACFSHKLLASELPTAVAFFQHLRFVLNVHPTQPFKICLRVPVRLVPLCLVPLCLVPARLVPVRPVRVQAVGPRVSSARWCETAGGGEFHGNRNQSPSRTSVRHRRG